MKKEILNIFKHFVIGLVIGLIASGLMLWSYNVGKKHCSTVETITDTITVTDTITNWQPQYIKEYRTDTAYLAVIDTLLDTVTDTVLVEIPISLYHYDTTITDTNYRTDLRLVLSGYNVTADSCTINTKIIPQQQKKQPLWHNLCPSIGIGYGTAGWGAFVGIGYKLF